MVRLAVVLSLSAVTSIAQQSPEPTPEPTPIGFVDKVVAIDGEDYRYVVYVPPGYDAVGELAARRWPLLVFLNGLGECGRDGKKQARVGLGAAIKQQPERWPFVVAFPQKPEGSTQWGDHEDLLLAVMAATERDYRTDARRTFLTGLSQGGSGTWQLGAQLADRWAAVAPICGYRLGAWNVEGLRNKPVWAFHGTADPVVPMRASEMLCAELKKAGGDPLLTLYEGVEHNSWDRAYRESALAEWLRVVVDEPLGARYLADHDAVEGVELHLEVQPAVGAAGSWGCATLQIALQQGGVEVSGRTEWLGDEARPDDAQREFSIVPPVPRDDRQATLAEQLVWHSLRDLVQSGVYAQLASAAPEAGTTPRVRLSLTVRGKHGDWIRHAAFAAGDSVQDSVKDSVVAACERIWQRSHAAAKVPAK